MAGLTTLPALSQAMFALSATKGFSQISGGIAANFQAKADADIRRKLGLRNANDRRSQIQALTRNQFAAQAATGGDPTVGSAVDVRADTAKEGEIDALRTLFAAEFEAERIEDSGENALIAGISGGLGTILGGAVTAVGSIETPQNVGARAPGARSSQSTAPTVRVPIRAGTKFGQPTAPLGAAPSFPSRTNINFRGHRARGFS